MSRPDPSQSGPGDLDDAAPRDDDVAELAARLGAIRQRADHDPEALVGLLRDLGADLRDREAGLRLPAVLALLDELETLVGLLAERGAAVAAELTGQDQRRRAMGAYRQRVARP